MGEQVCPWTVTLTGVVHVVSVRNEDVDRPWGRTLIHPSPLMMHVLLGFSSPLR